ncbi:MAG: M23 family metallopeptidase [Clostridia bacterium]|nr:M23 family metallopeptidase [Clostridia bacterium]
MLNPYKGGEFEVTSVYGNRTIGGINEFHTGLDIVGRSGKELLAICPGEVISSTIVPKSSNDITWQWGNYVIIKADTGQRIIYAHLSKRLVSKGQRVNTGDVIGIEGNTGYSFGSHCHLEVRNSSNKTSNEVNTPKFTGIPNKIGKYNVKVEKDLTKEEVQALINASKERVWHYWDEIKKEAPWAYEPLMNLYQKGYFKGADPGDLKISQTKMETLVVMARALQDKGII